MTKSNKLPQKKTQKLDQFKIVQSQSKLAGTDPTSLTASLTSTHIFNK